MDTGAHILTAEAALAAFEADLPANYFNNGEGMDMEEYLAISEAHTAFRDLIYSLRQI